MVLGCCWAPKDMIPVINSNIKNIKLRNRINPEGEVKWTKISKGNSKVYKEIIKYFFDNDFIHFRSIIIPDKSILHHQEFNQSHDEWYYKMMYRLVEPLISYGNQYSIFLDYKDIYGGQRTKKLKEVLERTGFEWGHPEINKIQCLPSDENQMIQIADILAGALSYHCRGLSDNEGKLDIISMIKRRSYSSLKYSTPRSESKFNIFYWTGEKSR